MRNSRAARVAGFVGALGASAALVGFAASGTGAYFTDSHDGAISASTGAIKVNIAPGDGQLNFTNLLPGEYKTQTISYQSTATGAEDVWLVFPTTGGTNVGGNPSEAFTGNPADAAGGGLGRYGHLGVDAPSGSFTSYNLNRPSTNPSDPGSSCGIDAYGHGGSNQQAANRSDHTVPFCGAPDAILLSGNMAPGQLDSATITFGYTPLLTGPQSSALAPVAQFKIVATQHGVFPNDPNN